MEQSRWLNPSHPQTLQNAVFLLYFEAATTLLYAGIRGLAIPLIAGYAAGGWGIANDKRWGYRLAVGMAAIPFALVVLLGDPLQMLRSPMGALIGFAFAVLLAYLLLHPDSRSHQRIWFS
jgi:hypothetical protein